MAGLIWAGDCWVWSGFGGWFGLSDVAVMARPGVLRWPELGAHGCTGLAVLGFVLGLAGFSAGRSWSRGWVGVWTWADLGSAGGHAWPSWCAGWNWGLCLYWDHSWAGLGSGLGRTGLDRAGGLGWADCELGCGMYCAGFWVWGLSWLELRWWLGWRECCAGGSAAGRPLSLLVVKAGIWVEVWGMGSVCAWVGWLLAWARLVPGLG